MQTYVSNALPLHTHSTIFKYNLVSPFFIWTLLLENSLTPGPFCYEVILFNDLIHYTLIFFRNRHICSQQLRDWRR